jgi:hypothetical protein
MTEALKLALEALENELCIDWTNNDEFNASAEKMHEAITAIKEALAQPAQEPVAWMCDGEPYAVKQMRLSINGGGEHPNQVPLYTTPQQRPWVGLTDEELSELSASGLALWALWRAIEAKLKKKNT